MTIETKGLLIRSIDKYKNSDIITRGELIEIMNFQAESREKLFKSIGRDTENDPKLKAVKIFLRICKKL